MKTLVQTILSSCCALVAVLSVLPQVSAGDEVLSPPNRLRSLPEIPATALNFTTFRLSSDSPDFNLTPSQSFTIEGWVRIDGFDESEEVLFGKDGSYVIRRDGTSNRLEFATRSGSLIWDELVTPTAVPVGAWVHVAGVYDQATKTKSLYIDGAEVGTQVITTFNTSALPFRLGGSTFQPKRFNGRLDSVRVWSVVRRPDQIVGDIDRDLTVYNATAGTADRVVTGLVAEWRLNQPGPGGYPDSSGKGHVATVEAGLAAVAAPGLAFRPAPPLASVSTAALDFPGSTGARVNVADTDLLDFAGAFTAEAWVQVGNAPGGTEWIVAKGNSWSLLRSGGNARVVFRTRSGGVDHNLVGSAQLLPGRWYHLAGTWDGVDKRIFVDGVLDGKAAWAGPLESNNTALSVGGNAGVAGGELDGQVDEVRVWAVARSVAQINAKLLESVRGFENGLRGSWSFDEESGTVAADASWANHPGSLGTGVTRINGLDFQLPVGPVATAGGALYFPADLAKKSCLVLPLNQRLKFQGSLTMECWLSVSSISTKPRALITKGQGWGLILEAATGKVDFRTRRGSVFSSLLTPNPLDLDRWYHVAATFDGTTKRLYLNGEQVASAAFTGALEDNPLQSVVIGGNSDTKSGQVTFHGRMDNVRLWSTVRGVDGIVAEMTRELRGTEPGLVASWRFDGAAPQNDISWHRINGALEGQPPAYAPMQVTGLEFGFPPDGPLALDFNRDAGDTDCVNLGNNPLFGVTTRLTAETWVHIDAVPAVGGTYALISKGSGAWEVLLLDNGKINFRTAGVTLANGGTAMPDFLSTNRIEPGEWYHVAVVWNGPEGTKEIHINGELDNSRTDLAGSIATNSFPVLLGARPLDATPTSQQAYYHGVLDEVRIWNVALPGLQIRTSFDNQLNGSELGLVGYWPFSQGGRNPDGSESMTVLDQALAPRTAINGTFCPGMGILNRVPGVLLGPPEEVQYALCFNGTDEYLEVGPDARFTSAVNSLTIEAWILPQGSGLRTILMQGDLGFGLALDEQGRLRYFDKGSPINSLASTGSVTPGVWQHVAVVVNGATNKTTFYINGLAAGSHDSASVPVKPGEPIIIGKLGPFGGSYFQGYMDEIRVWTSARTPTEIEFFALQPLPPGSLPGLQGYWQFNEGRGLTAGNQVEGSPDASLVNMDDTSWSLGHFFDGAGSGEPLNLAPNPATVGLWIGTVVLDQVNEVQTAIGGVSETVTPTGDTLTMRLLLHVDSGGGVRLLKDVVVMRTPAADGLPQQLVLLTDPLRIPEFEGVVERGGKLVGQRFGTVDFDFTGLDLVMLGGLGPGVDAAGRITLGRDHPTNPFRHKYHPQHGHGFGISRQISMSFDTAPADPPTAPPGYGSTWITGTYRETIMGLHKIPLKTAGRIELQRLNQVPALNAP